MKFSNFFYQLSKKNQTQLLFHKLLIFKWNDLKKFYRDLRIQLQSRSTFFNIFKNCFLNTFLINQKLTTISIRMHIIRFLFCNIMRRCVMNKTLGTFFFSLNYKIFYKFFIQQSK